MRPKSQEQLLSAFLKHYSKDDIKRSYSEVQEYGTRWASYCFGNRELSIYPANSTDEEPFHYWLDSYGDKDYLVEG